RCIPYIALGRNEIKIRDPSSIEFAINRYKPWGIINTAGYVKVDEAEKNPVECFAINTIAPEHMSIACNQHGIPFVTFSSDLVFDGEKRSQYVEVDSTRSLNIYGESKLAAEQRVIAAAPHSLVIRTSSFFGPWDPYNFVYAVL